MKRITIIFTILVCTIIVTSCGRNIPIEDMAISLILGIDLNENNELLFSESSPLFNQEAKKNVETYVTKAVSIRDSRKFFDAYETGEVTAAKIQVILIGKRILEHEHWYRILDTIYRNPIFSLNSYILMVDGSVSDLILFEPEQKAQLSLHLKDVVTNNIKRTRTVNATLDRIHRDTLGEGRNPVIPKVYKAENVVLEGVALLDHTGKYQESLNIDETSLLLLLRDEKNDELTISIPIDSVGEGGIFHTNELGITINRMKRKVKTKYEEDTFHFDINFKMRVNVVERIFSLNNMTVDDLEKLIEEQLEKKFEALIKKIQDKKIDPIGLGIIARAYEYDQYKKVEKHWGEQFAKSNIKVTVDITINSMGAIN